MEAVNIEIKNIIKKTDALEATLKNLFGKFKDAYNELEVNMFKIKYTTKVSTFFIFFVRCLNVSIMVLFGDIFYLFFSFKEYKHCLIFVHLNL